LRRTRPCRYRPGRVARPRRRADLRNHGAVDRLFHRPAGYALHGDARVIPGERNDGDVCVDERLPHSAVAKVYLQPTKRFLSGAWSYVEQIARSDEVIEQRFPYSALHETTFSPKQTCAAAHQSAQCPQSEVRVLSASILKSQRLNTETTG